jgi:hypothetical protein
MDNVADLVFSGEAAYAEFGLVGAAGDVNGDSFNDVIVGAWLADVAGSDRGRAYLYFGGPSMDNVPDRVFTGEAAGDRFGVAVMSSGDVNRDGYADLIVGAYWNDAAGVNAGRAYLYFGGASMDTIADVRLDGEGAQEGFGKSVCDAGDLDQDGYADVIVGAYVSSANGFHSGCAYIYYGGASMDAVADVVFPGEYPGDQLGYWVSSTQDVMGDGFPDVVIGASFNDEGATDAGRAYVLDFNRYFVESPNGGETWVAGQDRVVSWQGAEPADVWLSVDGGQSWERIAAGVGGSESNAVTVQVPDRPTLSASVMVTPADVSIGGEDRSDALFRIVPTTGVEGRPAGAEFAPPWPNPATSSVHLDFELPRAASVSLHVYDLTGRRVATPIAGQRLPAGRTTRVWRPQSLPEGLYQLRARIDEHEHVRTLVWLGAD